MAGDANKEKPLKEGGMGAGQAFPTNLNDEKVGAMAMCYRLEAKRPGKRGFPGL